MPANLPYEEDFFQRIVNVNWSSAPDVIVVFMDSSIWGELFVGTHTIIDKKTEFLTSFTALVQEEGFHPGYTCFAYKVSSNVGNFMTVTSPIQSEDLDKDVGYWFTVLVFALVDGGDMDKSLQRAIAGTKLAAPAIYMDAHSGPSDIPFDMAPPGLLWFVQTGQMHNGRSENWKIRYDKHRKDDASDLPNKMVQCYPLGPAFSGPWPGNDKTFTGYELYAYRLDKAGTGIVYAKELTADEGAGQNVDPAWNVVVVSGTDFRGIPYQDPPPLISADLIS